MKDPLREGWRETKKRSRSRRAKQRSSKIKCPKDLLRQVSERSDRCQTSQKWPPWGLESAWGRPRKHRGASGWGWGAGHHVAPDAERASSMWILLRQSHFPHLPAVLQKARNPVPVRWPVGEALMLWPPHPRLEIQEGHALQAPLCLEVSCGASMH